MRIRHLLLSIVAGMSAIAAPSSFVYTMTNASSGNQILVYARDSDGSLVYLSAVATGGNGTGYQLGSQGSLLTTGKYIFAANAGSDSISVLTGYQNLSIVGVFPSGGVRPVSVTYFQGVLYVLNAGSPNNITGFSFDQTTGVLTPLAGSTQSLSGASVSPDQVAFNKSGTALLVTEKSTNLIDVFPVAAGIAGPLMSYPSHGASPSGFAFGANGIFFVAEQWIGLHKPSASMSSYQLDANNVPHLITGSAPTFYPNTCCLVYNPSTGYVYASDYNTPFFSILQASSKGVLQYSRSVFTTASVSHLADIALSPDNLNLYILDHVGDNIFAYSFAANGGVTQLNGGSFAPESASGLIVR
jgi:6-phosphogluconolactonase (cycloisomerase 2 family)